MPGVRARPSSSAFFFCCACCSCRHCNSALATGLAKLLRSMGSGARQAGSCIMGATIDYLPGILGMPIAVLATVPAKFSKLFTPALLACAFAFAALISLPAC